MPSLLRSLRRFRSRLRRPHRPRARPQSSGAVVAGVLALTALVVFIYRDAFSTYFFNDDFQWLQGARTFALFDLLHLGRYSQFYRPVIEIYFFLGRRVLGCNAFAFHAANVLIHLLNTAVLYKFARAFVKEREFALLAAVFFAVQPGYVQAVVWVGAVTDLLPALWYLLTLWSYLLFLQRRGRVFYISAIVTFALCLLTHESSATLLVLLIALDAVTGANREEPVHRRVAKGIETYLPFGVLLAAYLSIEYVVNRHGYLITEGHYRLGWHSVSNALDYLISLYVGPHIIASRVVVALSLIAMLVRGTPRVRFFVCWMLVTIAPVSFFTWGNASRYLYLPAAGFAMLLAEAMLAVSRLHIPRMSAQAVRRSAIVVAVAIAARFTSLASITPAGFREETRPYERFAAAVRSARTGEPAGSVVYVDRAAVDGIPVLYRDPAAEVASCGSDVHVAVR
jgi:hypothetical protein